MKQKEKEEAKRILPFFPLQSSILRRKTQITNPPTSHLNSNFIPNKISPIPRNEIDEKARTKKKKPHDNRIVISFSDFHQNPDRYHGPTLKGDTRYLITIIRQKCMTFPCPIYRPTREKKRSLFFPFFLSSFPLFFLFSRRPRFRQRRTMKSPKTKSEIRRARTPRGSSRYESLPWKRRVCSVFAYTRCPDRRTRLFPSLFPRKTSFARQLALKL